MATTDGKYDVPESYTAIHKLKTSSSKDCRLVSAPSLCSVGVVITF
jgi:hypothetical protein